MKRYRGLKKGWGLNRRFGSRHRKIFSDKISANHHYNKIGDRQFKYSKVLKRKWKNPKVGLRRKRYYSH